MRTYLSIDLTYWANKFSTKSDNEGLVLFIDRLIETNIPIFVSEFHDGMLSHIHTLQVDKIINVDYYSDVIHENTDSDLNEVTWASYYKNRHNAIYEWRYPSRKECFIQKNGLCEINLNGDKTWNPNMMGYKKVIHKEGLRDINIQEVIGIGISLSPNWCQDWVFNIYALYGFLDYMESTLRLFRDIVID